MKKILLLITLLLTNTSHAALTKTTSAMVSTSDKCLNAFDCESIFSATVGSTGTVTNENLDWIASSSINNTSNYVLLLNTNILDGTNPITQAMNCQASVRNNTTGTIIHTSFVWSTTTSVTVATYTAGARAINDFYITCQKNGSDYRSRVVK